MIGELSKESYDELRRQILIFETESQRYYNRGYVTGAKRARRALREICALKRKFRETTIQECRDMND